MVPRTCEPDIHPLLLMLKPRRVHFHNYSCQLQLFSYLAKYASLEVTDREKMMKNPWGREGSCTTSPKCALCLANVCYKR